MQRGLVEISVMKHRCSHNRNSEYLRAMMQMTRKMHTSRSQLERLLDPDNDKVLLETINRAASAIGKRATLILEDASNT
jgi:hypothetical protein